MRSLLLSLLGIIAISAAFTLPGDAKTIQEAARDRAPLMTGADPALRTWSPVDCAKRPSENRRGMNDDAHRSDSAPACIDFLYTHST